MGCVERTPKDWSEGIMGVPPWDSKDLTADQNRRYRSFTRGVNPHSPRRPKSELYLDFPES